MDTSPHLSDEQLSAMGGLLHMAFKEIRLLGWDGRTEQAADLADALCSLPLWMFSPKFDLQAHVKMLEDYQQRYPHRSGLDYVALLKAIREMT